MHYCEQVVDGILCWRNNPEGYWRPFTPEQLTTRLVEAEKKLAVAFDLAWINQSPGCMAME